MTDTFKVVREDFKYWGTLDKIFFFDDLGLHYHSSLMLGSHPIIQLLDTKSQVAHFENKATEDEKEKNQAALDVLVHDRNRSPRTFVVDIGEEFGYGLFAGDDITQGTFIGEYSGLLCWKGYTPVMLSGGLFKGEPKSPYDMGYLMPGYKAQINQENRMVAMILGSAQIPEPGRFRIDASLVGGDSRFINHLTLGEKFYRPDGSIIEGPNVEVIQGCHQGYFRKWLFAGQDIKKGEELRMDYTDSYWNRQDPISRLFFACKDGLLDLYRVDTTDSKAGKSVKEAVH